MDDAHLNVDRCPFLHGTVDARPFPGYVHGKHPSICPHGCVPRTDVGEGETVEQMLLREAFEWQELYHHEMKSPDHVKQARKSEILDEVKRTGTYKQTFEELQHGMRVAWRNAPKCSNRKFWNAINLLDCRDVCTNKGMFDACCHHLDLALKSGVTEMYMSVFEAASPGAKTGPRVWNDQLMRYAGYVNSDGEVLGDPANLKFTSMLEEKFGWTGPAHGRTAWDLLPLVCQIDPNGPPEIFQLPLTLAHSVKIWHPRYPELSSLGLRWYPVPAVCALELSVGGLLYTAMPFNGWYADVEIVRDFCDEGRYNMLKPVAELLGFNTATNLTLWRDQAQLIINEAVLHSFAHAGMAIVDHHTLIDGFYTWYHSEIKNRGYCPGNWKWIIPPQASATSRAYLGLNKMTEYTLKPAYLYAPGWSRYADMSFGRPPSAQNVKKLFALLFVARFVGLFKRKLSMQKQQFMIAYCSISGTVRKYVSKIASYLQPLARITVFDLEDYDPLSQSCFDDAIQTSALLIVCLPTYGNGDVPYPAMGFLKSLQALSADATKKYKGKLTAVLGFGSSSFPLFCGGAEIMSESLVKAGAHPVCDLVKIDVSSGASIAVQKWASTLVSALSPTLAPDHSKEIVLRGISSQDSLLGVVCLRVSVLSDEEASALGQKMIVQETNTTVTNREKNEESMWLEAHVSGLKPLLSEKATPENFVRQTTLLSLDLTSCIVPYVPGDHLSLLPANVISSVQLEEFARLLGAELDKVMKVSLEDEDTRALKERAPLVAKIKDKFTTLRQILTSHAALNDVMDMEKCAILGRFATILGLFDAKKLNRLGASIQEHQQTALENGLRWIDIFTLFPSLQKRMTVDFMLSLLPLNYPRTYSIASSMSFVGPRVDLCIGRLVRKREDGVLQKGSCSEYVSTQLAVGAKVNFKISKCPSFRLPYSCTAPIVFIASGTGIAPMRGFWQERTHLVQNGCKLAPAVLIFGMRSNEEWLFREEMKEACDLGALTKVILAYSREKGHPKEYVQDAFSKNSAKLATIIEHLESRMYICGSAQMANDVLLAMARLFPAASAKILSEQRFHVDIYGSLPAKESGSSTEAPSAALILKRAKTCEMQEIQKLIQDMTVKEKAPLNDQPSAGSTLKQEKKTRVSKAESLIEEMARTQADQSDELVASIGGLEAHKMDEKRSELGKLKGTQPNCKTM